MPGTEQLLGGVDRRLREASGPWMSARRRGDGSAERARMEQIDALLDTRLDIMGMVSGTSGEGSEAETKVPAGRKPAGEKGDRHV